MDSQKFTEEVLKLERLLYCVSWSMLSDQQDCADAVQEAVARAWEKRRALRNEKAFKQWLVQILSNVCRDVLRKRQKQPLVPLDDEKLPDMGDASDAFSTLEILQCLSPDYRTIVTLHYIEGYRIRDIAQMLDTPIGTVKSRLMRARIFLRDTLETQSELHGGTK